MNANLTQHRLKAGMVGLGMIFDDTYRPFFESAHHQGLYRRDFGLVDVELTAVASRTGNRGAKYKSESKGKIADFANLSGPGAVQELLAAGVDAVCVATPDDRHFDIARKALEAGKHVLIEKPSVLSLQELDTLQQLAERQGVLAKVVYHKLADPDHKKLRTHVVNGVIQHVNNGYCTLLEPKQISGSQFAEWIQGRNPGTYVAVHYIKLIDFTFGGLVSGGLSTQYAVPSTTQPPALSSQHSVLSTQHSVLSTDSSQVWQLKRITATGQRGLVGPATGNTWDSVQLQIVYGYPDGREAAFDIHTSWVTPDNFPGYVEQEVQFRFDNAIWNAHQRKRGVELTIEGRSPQEFKITPNHHYNGTFIEPWGERSQRGYGVEIIQKFFEETAYVEFGGPKNERPQRLQQMRGLTYNDVTADRNTVAIVQAMEAILAQHAAGRPGCLVEVNAADGGLVLRVPGNREAVILYPGRV
jgi:D-galacturonate reductase